MEKISTFANRLKTLLAVRQITQAELARLTGISKSSVTHYVKGDWVGKQDAVYAIATATDVNEAWLIGYDVPMDKSLTSPMVYCEDCGMNYDSSRREETLAHEEIHVFDKTTAAMAMIIKGRRTNLRDLSRQTGIAYGILRRSLTYQSRALRADEFLILCRALELDPVTFVPQKERLGEEVE